MIGIRTTESAVWHALLTKSQVISSIQLPEAIETYLSRLVIRAMMIESQTKFTSAGNSECHEQMDRLKGGFADDFGDEEAYADSESAEGELHMLGDECLVLAGLMPERAIREQIPVSYFVSMAFRAYSQLAQEGSDPIYDLLASHLVDCVDVLHTMREIEVGSSCIDPLNAFELWHDAGSMHAWEYLTNMTNAHPVHETSYSLN